jgi:hypothetical protein
VAAEIRFLTEIAVKQKVRRREEVRAAVVVVDGCLALVVRQDAVARDNVLEFYGRGGAVA